MAQKIQGLIKTPQQIWKDNAMMQAAQKKFKEVYVFNLAQTQTGVLMVTAQMLEQLFDASLTTLAPKPVQLVRPCLLKTSQSELVRSKLVKTLVKKE